MTRVNRRLASLGLLAVVVIVPLAGCSSGTGGSGAATPLGAGTQPGGTRADGPVISSSASTSASPISINSSSASPAPVATEINPPGDIPDNQAYVAFRATGWPVSVKVPEGWARADAGSGVTSFADKLNSIEVRLSRSGTAPTSSSVTGTDLPGLRARVPQLANPSVSSVARQGGDAILLTYQCDSPVDPVTGKVVRDAVERYTFYRGGVRLDLSLVGPVNADNVDPWRIVSDSVRWAS